MTYSYSYINVHGNGDVVDVKVFPTDQEAIEHGKEILEVAIMDVIPQPKTTNFQDPQVIIENYGNSYPFDDDTEPLATANIIAEFTDGKWSDEIREVKYDCNIRVVDFV